MRVLISGASVAGPALAYWLNRYGHSTTVVERAPTLRGGGYAVDFRGPVHLGVLDQMGILGRIRAASTGLAKLSIVDADGHRLARMPAEIFAGDVEILRGDLAEILYDVTRSDTGYRFGDSITALEQEPDGVRVSFEHAPPERFDLVVGADGVHSQVRRLAFGEESRFATDLGLHVCIFTVPNWLELDHSGVMFSVPRRTAGLYAARAGAMAMLTFTADEPVPPDDAGRREFVAAAYAGLGWEVPRILDAMRHAPDFYFDTTSQIHLDRWSTGRVALIGDAGYAAGPGGNGTGTAVVAAYVLAGELAAAGGDHRVAFDAYERRLRSYVDGGQKQAAGGVDYLAPATWKKIRARDRFFRLAPYLPGVKPLIRRLSTRTATALTLPAYPVERRECRGTLSPEIVE